MSNSGLNSGTPWHSGTDGAQCFICKEDVESVTHFLVDYPDFRENTHYLEQAEIKGYNFKHNYIQKQNGTQIYNFIGNLDCHQKALLLLES